MRCAKHVISEFMFGSFFFLFFSVFFFLFLVFSFSVSFFVVTNAFRAGKYPNLRGQQNGIIHEDKRRAGGKK